MTDPTARPYAEQRGTVRLGTLFTGLLLIGGVVIVIACAFYAGNALAGRTDKEAAFERTYATVPVHAVEFIYWVARHVYLSLKSTASRKPRVVRAVGALVAVVLMLLLPVVALAASDEPTLSSNGLAAGIGALVWGLLLESTSLRERTRHLAGAYIIRLRVWLFAVVLCIADGAVIAASAWGGVTDLAFSAALTGSAYVAAADLVSTYVAFILCPWVQYPLADP